MQKLFLIFIVLLGGYLFIIFKMPDLADSIAKNFGLEGFNYFILNIKEFIDNLILKFPSKEDINSSYSGVIEVKNQIIDGFDYAKDKIDSTRIYFSGSQDTIDSLRDGYNDVTEFLSGATDKIENTKNIVNDIKSLTGSGITE